MTGSTYRYRSNEAGFDHLVDVDVTNQVVRLPELPENLVFVE